MKINHLFITQQNYPMFKEENYEQIFSQKITNQSIDIIKKFFIFQPSTQTTSKPYTLISKLREPAAATINNRRTNNKFTGGFQQSVKLPNNNQEEESVLQSSSIILKSKKAPSSDISSLLLGLTGRINRQSQIKLAELQIKNNENSPDKKISYQQVMANLNKIKKQNRIKYSSLMQTSNTSNSHSLSNQNQLPLLQKRSISPDRRNTSSVINTFTPITQNKSSTPTYRSQQEKNQKSQRMNLQSNRAISLTYSSKLIKPPEQSPFAKGYMFYDPNAKQFLQKFQMNTAEQPYIKKNLTSLSAKNYIVLNRENMRIIAHKNSDQQIQIASLTKIMTCYLCILACRKYKVDPKDAIVRVSERAQQMPGTSAQLQAGDIITLKDLLYGLMLPSGNDASVAIGQTVGKIIQKNKKKPSKKTYYQTFIYHMNYLAKQLGIQQNFQNTSGLSFNPNYSSPKAVSILTAVALKNSQFYQIVNCKQYELEIRNERYGLVRRQQWKNTNKLLWKGWQGVKTGTTQSAGHCLMSCKGDYIISVYDCQTLNKRFTQCMRIYEQIMNLPHQETQFTDTNNTQKSN